MTPRAKGGACLPPAPFGRFVHPDEIDKVEALGIEPWAGGERRSYFRLCVSGLTGRRIVVAP